MQEMYYYYTLLPMYYVYMQWYEMLHGARCWVFLVVEGVIKAKVDEGMFYVQRLNKG